MIFSPSARSGRVLNSRAQWSKIGSIGATFRFSIPDSFSGSFCISSSSRTASGQRASASVTPARRLASYLSRTIRPQSPRHSTRVRPCRSKKRFSESSSHIPAETGFIHKYCIVSPLYPIRLPSFHTYAPSLLRFHVPCKLVFSNLLIIAKNRSIVQFWL